MRILVLNPNCTVEMTQRMVAVGERVVAVGTELLAATAPRSFPYISSRAEAQIAGALVLEMIADRVSDVDAVVIAAYGDPGLKAARELFDLPIVGMAEAAMLTACMLGERFSLVTFSESLVPWYLESVELCGLRSRLASIRVPPEQVRSVVNARTELREPLLEEVAQAAQVDGADVVILGGAPLAGLAGEIEKPAAVLIDPIEAAIKQAEVLVDLAPRGAFAGSLARPPAKPNDGLAESLSRWIRHEPPIAPATEP
ncbi:MAG: Asp/Glu/hydantoin racemase [Chromatiales bacterium]|nr:Asp/Glu/hydantoin racemase [Chromatiales bacterium]